MNQRKVNIQDKHAIGLAWQMLRVVRDNSSLKSSQCISFSVKNLEIICQGCIRILLQSPPLLEIGEAQDTFCIFGDIHGRYNEMMKIFQCIENYDASDTEKNYKYLFLGDYVDRGSHSVEVMVTLLCMKIVNRNNVHLLRGNHEVKKINFRYGFYRECTIKYGKDNGEKVYDMINEVFDYLPLACVLKKEFFCVHGGIGPQLKNINDIKKIQYPLNIEDFSMEFNLVWADPDRDNDNTETELYRQSRSRGVLYSARAIDEFFTTHPQISKIIRAHECVQAGYQADFGERVVTVFSAPYYKDTQTCAAILLLKSYTNKIQPLYIYEDQNEEEQVMNENDEMGKENQKREPSPVQSLDLPAPSLPSDAISIDEKEIVDDEEKYYYSPSSVAKITEHREYVDIDDEEDTDLFENTFSHIL